MWYKKQADYVISLFTKVSGVLLPKRESILMEWWTCSLTAWSCPPFPASSSSTAYACQVPDPLVSHWDVLIIPECIIHFNTSFGNGFVIII